jgi:hypothetical protein
MATPYDLNTPVPTIGFGTGSYSSGAPTGLATPGGQDWSWLAPLLCGVGNLATS